MNILAMVWTWIKNILIWAWNNKQTALYIVLSFIILSLSKCNYDKNNKIEQLTIEKNGLGAKLQSQVTSGNGEVKIVYRDRDKIITKTQYLPVEGYVTIEQLNQVQQAHKSYIQQLKDKLITGNATLEDIKNFVIGTSINTGNEIITVHDRGMCLRPGFFLQYDNQYNSYPVNAGIDLKCLFFQRYSAGFLTTLQYPGIYVSRHLDDATMNICNNVELEISYNRPYKEFDKSILGIGLRSNF